MRLRLLLTSVFFFIASAAAAQEAERDSVVAPLGRLFDGMRAGDSTAVRAAFHPTARLLSVVQDSAGAFAVRETAVDRFVEAVGQPHEAVWDERIGAVDVRIDGGMATAWVPYAFYLGDQFSHCGVNAVDLVRTSEGWRILHLTDTRRTSDCEELLGEE